MKNSETVWISVWTEKSERLFENVRHLLEEFQYDTDDMPRTVFEADRPVSMVFAGQYSAGKSSMIKALTKRDDIAIGEGITTQKTYFYDWNGIHIIDTPGIHTTLRPDHDAIAYQAIADADMLVYVVTQELFDDFIGRNFRKLLLEKEKAGEMILVVNKMADVGNTIENRDVKLQNLREVTAPYTPEQLRTVFIDAESYLDSLTEPEADIAAELRKRSNYDGLVETLNTFAQDKALSFRMTTGLYRLHEFLQKAILEYQPSTGDTDIDALEEHLLQERHILASTQWRIETSVKTIIEDAAVRIRAKGREIANSVYDCHDEADANEKILEAYHDVDRISDACVSDIVSKIDELSNNGQAQLDSFYCSDFSQALKLRLDHKRDKKNSLIENILKSDILRQTGSGIISNTLGANAAAGGLKAFSGSNIHQIVLNVGHFFGHSFRPWEAVKLVRGIHIAGKALGIFGVVFSFGMQIKEDANEDERQREMRHNREMLRAGFANAADEVAKYFNQALTCFVRESYLPRIAGIDEQVAAIRDLRTGKSDACKRLESLQNDCRRLISEIHQECFPESGA
ncbi:MAG: GTPase domain-containing protein [Lachnospiraceae bacterium]|nr:GTPase domain-containing protein [Lachnospiraceae bacterium]